MSSPTAAWAQTPSGTLSFGFVDVAGDNLQLVEQVTLKNYSNNRITYDITPTFRYADDADNGAVSVAASPSSVRIGPGQTKTVTVRVTIDGSLLRGNSTNSGSGGTDPGPITLDEYDGYLVFSSDDHTMQMPWHVLPRQAAELNIEQNRLNFNKAFELAPGIAVPSDEIGVKNNGAGTAQNDGYALIALSEDLPEGEQGAQNPVPDLRAVGVNTFPVPAGFCSAQESFIWAFAMNTHERQTHLLPVIHFVDLDIDQDGVFDYEVFNAPVSYPTLGDERELAWALNLATGQATAFFFAEHSTNTANTVLYICAEQVGLSGTDMLATNVDVEAGTFDYYYGASVDVVDGITITPLGEQYVALASDVEAKDSGLFEVLDFGPFPGNSPELGVLMLTNGDRGSGASGGATVDTEALIVPVKGVDVPKSYDDARELPGYFRN
jgi:hypothetical protein